MSTGAFDAWNATMRADGALAVGITWPFPDQYHGLAAARFDAAGYGAAFNAGDLTGLVQRASADNQKFYVLAPPDVQDDSPHTMTAWERFLNAGFSYGDAFADAAGLPSLATIENVLNPFHLSPTVLVWGVVIVGAVWLAGPLLRRK